MLSFGAFLALSITNVASLPLDTLEGELAGVLEDSVSCRVLNPQVQCEREGRGGYYPDKCEPAKYYQCLWDGEKWLGISMLCAPGTIWKQRQKTCLHAPEEEPTLSDTLATSIDKPCKPRDPNVVCPRLGARRAYYADRCDPANYFQCQQVDDEWIGHHMSCAPGTVWSQPTRACIHAEPAEDFRAREVVTKLEVDSEGRLCKPIVRPNIACITIGRSGYYPHRCSRSMYHQCQWTGQNWIAHAMNCAPGTVWSQWKKTCIRADLEQLVNEALGEEAESKQCKPRNPNNVCQKRTYYTDRCDETRFYQCQMTEDGWTAYPISCAPGTIWSQPQKSCVHPEAEELVEQRSIETYSDGKPCKPLVPPSVACITIGRSGYYPHRCSRSMYHQCQWTGQNWIAHTMNCAPGTVWSQIRVSCVHPRVIQEEQQEIPEEKPEQTPEGESPEVPDKSMDDGELEETDDEQYAKEILSALAKAIDDVDSRRRRPDQSRRDTVDVQGVRGPDRARGEGLKQQGRWPDRARDQRDIREVQSSRGVWANEPIAEAKEGISQEMETNSEDMCEISGVTDDGHAWTHRKRSVPGDREKYVMLLEESQEVVMSCAYGTAFSLETCDCTVRMIPKQS